VASQGGTFPAMSRGQVKDTPAHSALTAAVLRAVRGVGGRAQRGSSAHPPPFDTSVSQDQRQEPELPRWYAHHPQEDPLSAEDPC
jgi:hypothetical protein